MIARSIISLMILALLAVPSLPAQADTAKEELHLLDANGNQISAVFYTPKDQQPPYKTVILSHGFGGRYPYITEAYAHFFAEHGYAACAFNFRTDDKNDMLDTSVLTEAATLNAVIDQIKTRDDVDLNNLFLFGESQGGFVTTHVAAGRDDIKALVLLYPAYVLQYDTWARHREVSGGEGFDPVTFDPEALDLSRITATQDRVGMNMVSKLYSVDSLRFNIYAEMRTIGIPALIVHGTVDRVVPVQYGRDAADPEKGFPHAEFVEIPGADHVFFGPAWQTAADAALDFLNRQ